MPVKQEVLSLARARREGRLEEFIAQAERLGYGEGDEERLAALLRTAAKPPQSEDRTSRSPSRDGSREK